MSLASKPNIASGAAAISSAELRDMAAEIRAEIP